MEIIFYGRHNTEDAIESLTSVMHLFNERYKIKQFREMRLSVTLVDQDGEDVELIDSETLETYRTFEVQPRGITHKQATRRAGIKLVIDNTKKS